MNLLESGSFLEHYGEIKMINKLIGEAMQILSMRYNAKTFSFEVECIMPGHTVPSIYQFHKNFFPHHAPIALLDEMVQIGEAVQIWLKEEELLKKEGWIADEKNNLGSPDSPFLIGKGKKVYLGGAHKGVVCLDKDFVPFVVVKGYRFAPTEIKCILRLDNVFTGKNAKIVSKMGEWTYDAEKQSLVTSQGYKFGPDDIGSMIDLLRRARLV
jgi:hypothetical protein